MSLEDKIEKYKYLRTQIEELEKQRKELVAEILETMPKDTQKVQCGQDVVINPSPK